MRIVNVVGARPNFMKIAPLMAAYEAHPSIEPVLVHTGQHYDQAMSEAFFADLGIRPPEVNLGVGGGSHASQHARVIAAFEPVCQERRPDLVLVVGDVNSTVSCALVAAKMGIAVAHVEAGLRSGDRSMPEELNRIVTDHLSSLLFVSEESGLANLAREGIGPAGVHFVGNVMIDSLRRSLPRAAQSPILSRAGVEAHQYAVLTLHRPANVDDPARLAAYVALFEQVGRRLPLVFPAHPRTVDSLRRSGLLERLENAAGIRLIEPLGYLDFLQLVRHARLVLTDSGGIQEETTVLKVPCVTMRDTTERPASVWAGTNLLAGTDPARIFACFEEALALDAAAATVPARWDGRAAVRIAAILADRAAWSGTAAPPPPCAPSS